VVVAVLHVKLIASGRVQGVGFRDFACRIGGLLSLVGYAKNLPDGTVEIVAEGEEEKIEEFKNRVHARMPFGMHVDKLDEMEHRSIKAASYASFGVQY
jgi:acylphosphatase